MRYLATCGLILLLFVAAAQQQQDPANDPFKGVTTNGTVQTGLFPIKASGVSTAPVRTAAERFIATLTDEQKARTLHKADDIEWRRWNNVHRYNRAGVNFDQMNDAQKEAALALLRASLSVKGFETSRNIMRLNGYLTELVNRPGEYGEGLYHLTIMGTPSASEPWGWQLDGHHLIINYFVLRDQVVMTPTFMGSEPVVAQTSKYGHIAVLQAEQDKGLALVNSLTADQRAQAILNPQKTQNNSLAQAFRDNLVLDYAGLRANQLSAAQQRTLLDLVHEYVRNMDEGHARVRMEEVRAQLNDTYFAWIGGTDTNAVFYYRIHSPVILIEFDHQSPVALPGERVPGRAHIHTVVRTPNGNDYGKDLLRQHYQNAPAGHGH